MIPFVKQSRLDDYRALVAAAGNGDAHEVQRLLSQGVNCNDGINIDQGKKTPLMQAAAIGNNEIVQILLTAGADIDATDFDGTVLMQACKKGHLETVKLLIKAGADIENGGVYFWAMPS